MANSTVRITEIFFSLQGESTTVGLPTVFVRLTGCPLRCNYCDTEYAFHGGTVMSMDEVLDKVDSYNAEYITVTGGEPLAQKSAIPLMEALCDKGYKVSLETSGAMSVAEVDSRVVKVIDIKTPDSGEVEKNDYSNFEKLEAHDQIKFVLCSKSDYEWARFKMDQLQLIQKGVEVLFSASHGQLSSRDLADWIIADNLKVRFQLQLHKYLWNDEPGR